MFNKILKFYRIVNFKIIKEKERRFQYIVKTITHNYNRLNI